MDLDEARIPLWTLRTTYELFSSWGPLSSGFIDAYWVPGWLDTTTGYLNIQGVSPYSQPPPLQGPGIQVFDKLPRYETGNSRYGFKFQTVVDRDYNLSVWFYRTFPITPIPTLKGFSAGNKYVTTTLNHGLTNAIGAALSWYSEVLTSVVRTEVVLFNDEPAMLAYKNIGSAIASGFTQPGEYETANMLRGEFGVDHNFFVPQLNPSSSFLAIVSLVFQANLSETGSKDFRTPIIKPSAIERELKGGAPAGSVAPEYCDNPNAPGPKECDFVNQDVFGGVHPGDRALRLHGWAHAAAADHDRDVAWGPAVHAVAALSLHGLVPVRRQVHQHAHVRRREQRLRAWRRATPRP